MREFETERNCVSFNSFVLKGSSQWTPSLQNNKAKSTV